MDEIYIGVQSRVTAVEVIKCPEQFTIMKVVVFHLL